MTRQMGKMLRAGTIALSVFITASAAQAETFVRTIHGDVTTFHLPRDMCDATNTRFGDNLMSVLQDTAQRSEVVPNPILVFADCLSLRSSTRALQPRTWGYFGNARMPKQNPAQFNQKIFNDFLQSQQGKAAFKKGFKSGEKVTNESLKKRGQDFQIGQTMPIPPDSIDQYAHITRMISAVAINEQKATLVIGAMSKVLDGKLIVHYMYTRLDEDALTAQQMQDDMHAVAVKMHRQ